MIRDTGLQFDESSNSFDDVDWRRYMFAGAADVIATRARSVEVEIFMI